MAELTRDDLEALDALRKSAEARGVLDDAIHLAMERREILPSGLDPRHCLKRPTFTVIFSLEEHGLEAGANPPVRSRHFSVSLPTSVPPTRTFVRSIAKALGFTRGRLYFMPSDEHGWVVTHVWEVLP